MASATDPPYGGRLLETAPLYGRSRTVARLAWRNIWRQRRRTRLLIAVVTYVTMATMWFWGLNDGLNDSILSGYARFLAAPMMVQSEAYVQDPNPEHPLPPGDLQATLEQLPGVAAAAPRLEFSGFVRSAYAGEGARIRGIDPALEGTVSAVPDHIASGRMVQAPGELVLGAQAAERLDVRLGERLAVDASALAGPQGLGLVVVGLLQTGLAAVDEHMILIHLDDARALTGVETATGLALAIPRNAGEKLRRAVQAQLPAGVEALDLLELLGPAATRVRVSRILMVPVGMLFALFGALAVTSTVLVSVMERTREFGIVLAVGLAPAYLAAMVVLEALFTTLVGWLLGLILGYAVLWVFSTWNLLGPLFTGAASVLSGFGIGKELYVAISPRYALIATATVALSALLSLLLPARRALALEPVPAMRAG